MAGMYTQAIPIFFDSVRFLVPVLQSRTFTVFFLGSYFRVRIFNGSCFVFFSRSNSKNQIVAKRFDSQSIILDITHFPLLLVNMSSFLKEPYLDYKTLYRSCRRCGQFDTGGKFVFDDLQHLFISLARDLKYFYPFDKFQTNWILYRLRFTDCNNDIFQVFFLICTLKEEEKMAENWTNLAENMREKKLSSAEFMELAFCNSGQ